MDKYFHPTVYNGCNYLSMLEWKLNHVCKGGARLVYICLYFHQLLMSIQNTDRTSNHMQLIYIYIYAGSTQQYTMITVMDDIDSRLQVQLTGSPRDRHAKTHAGPPTGIPQPGPWLVGGCSASQSEARPENPRQPTRIHAWDSSGITLLRYIHITVLEYLCTFGICVAV